MKRFFFVLLFIFLIPFVASAQSFKITKMICKSQEGWVTSDKIYIRYSINGSEYKRYNSSAMGFSEGAERTNVMSVAIKRDDKISIELWDEDMFDDDDFLGRFTLTCDWAKKGTHDFHQEWGTAHYYIEYNIE